MIFLFGVIVALIAGKLLGGRASRIGQIQARWWWLAPVALCIQIAVIYGFPGLNDDLFAGIIIATYGALVVIAAANHTLPGARIMALGIFLNLLVMVANGGLMPISPEIIQRAGRFEPWKVGDGLPGTRLTQSKDVLRLPEDTRLEFLADRYWTGLPGRLGIIFSIGDVILLGGMCFLIVRTMTAASNDRTTRVEAREDHRTGSNNGLDISTHSTNSAQHDTSEFERSRTAGRGPDTNDAIDQGRPAR